MRKYWAYNSDLATLSWRNYDILRIRQNQSNQAEKVVILNVDFSGSNRFQKSVLLVTDTISESLVSFKDILLGCRFADKHHFVTHSVELWVYLVISEIGVFWGTKWRRHLFYFIYYCFIKRFGLSHSGRTGGPIEIYPI